MRILLGPGAIGETVKQVQTVLGSNGFNFHTCDGWYGPATTECVKAYQRAKALQVTGTIDDEGTWQLLMKCAMPTVSERCLQLTAAFEDHGFEKAVGNFDGALLTWGIIGFTLASGGIQNIVQNINRTKAELVKQVFSEYSGELLQLMTASRDWQLQWATQHTLTNGGLAEPWRTMFCNFGALPEVKREQLKQVQTRYMAPAINTAKRLGLTSELGLALCFDIHVQNGGIKHTALDQIRQQSGAGVAEPRLRAIVANAVADWAKAAWSDDVRRRKLTIATGHGTVHGHEFVLENWGLSGDFEAPELTAPSVTKA